MKLALILVTAALAAESFAQTPAEPQYEGSLGVSSYSGGYVLAWDSPQYTRVTIYGPDTKAVYSSSLKQNQHLFYPVWAVDSDGVAIRAYTIRDGHKGEGRIDVLNAAGNLMRTINTAAYTPQHLSFAPDHTIWTVGYDMLYARESPSESQPVDFNVLHHYSRTGQEIGQGLPWTKIAGVHNPQTALQLCLGARYLFVTDDRIGFLSTLDSGHSTWIEANPAGTLLGKYELGDYRTLCYHPLAMTASGDVYARIYREDHFDGWAKLDRSSGEWRKVSGSPRGRLIGADGDDLIFSQQDGGWTVLHSIATASLKIQPPARQVAAVANQE